ncbi:MAG: hypothetical protein U0R19_21275 [Bryobacteraceae bacterium]
MTIQQRERAIYSNLGVDNRYDLLFFQKTPSWVDITAIRFRAMTSGALDSVLLPVSVEPGHLPLSIALYADEGGKPGRVLEGWTVEAHAGAAPMLTMLTSRIHPPLMAEEDYWITVIPALPASVVWHRNNQCEAGGCWCGCSLDGLLQIQRQQMMPALLINAVEEQREEKATGSGLASIARHLRSLIFAAACVRLELPGMAGIAARTVKRGA